MSGRKRVLQPGPRETHGDALILWTFACLNSSLEQSVAPHSGVEGRRCEMLTGSFLHSVIFIQQKWQVKLRHNIRDKFYGL